MVYFKENYIFLRFKGGGGGVQRFPGLWNFYRNL